jgi:tetratricopeptide (TPR) repeat protein
MLGSTSASELLAWVDEQERAGDYGALLLAERAAALAMLGRRDEAIAVLDRLLAELPAGAGQWSTVAIWYAGEIELLLGDPPAAAELLERACTEFEQIGERGLGSTSQAQLARAQYELGRLDEAERKAAALHANDDTVPQVLWRQVEAKLHARRGEPLEAERLAREAVSIVARTQMLNAQADAYADLAEVLALAGKADAAREALHEAVERYMRKENLVGAERARARLAELERAAAVPAS